MLALILCSLIGLTVGQGGQAGQDPYAAPGNDNIVTCPDHKFCVKFEQCDGKGFIITDGSGAINKRTGVDRTCNIFEGICCALDNNYVDPKPPPPTTTSCALQYDCVPPNQCNSDGKIITDGSNVIQKRNKLAPCKATGYTDIHGVCCLLPDYIVHPPNQVQRECYNYETCERRRDCTDVAVDTNKNPIQCFRNKNKKGVCCNDQPIPDIVATKGPIVDPIPIESYDCGHKNNISHKVVTSDLKHNEAFFGEFPWQAIIFKQNYTFECGAVIINELYLLTAAHCVEDKFTTYNVRIGEYQVDKFNEPLPYTDLDVKTIHIHPEYKSSTNHNGVALLELYSPITFHYHINSICLPDGPYSEFNPLFDYNAPHDHHECYVTGWGKGAFKGRYSARLKKIRLGLLDKEYCQTLLRKHSKLNPWFILHHGFLCLGGKEGLDACKGDGGGPVSCYNTFLKRFEVVGITSWGLGCGDKGVPGVYMDVHYYVPWMRSIFEKQSQTFPY